MSVLDVLFILLGLIIFAVVMIGCWFLADLIIPQSEIDKIDRIGRWAKEELERRETER